METVVVLVVLLRIDLTVVEILGIFLSASKIWLFVVTGFFNLQNKNAIMECKMDARHA